MAELPAPAEHVGEKWLLSHVLLDSGKDQVEVVFKKMLYQHAGNRVAEVIIWMATPAQNKLPDRLWFFPNVIADGNDRLPAQIGSFVRADAWQY